MQNRSMGVGSVWLARGNMAVWGRSTFHLLSSDRTKAQTYLDQWYLEELKGKSPGQVKNCLGGYRKEDEAVPQSKGWGEWGWGQAVLQQAEQWPAVRRGRFRAKWILGHVTGAKLLSHSAEPSKSHFAHLLLPQSNPSENRGQDSQELCCENKVLAEYARGNHEKIQKSQQDPLRQQQRIPKMLG